MGYKPKFERSYSVYHWHQRDGSINRQHFGPTTQGMLENIRGTCKDLFQACLEYGHFATAFKVSEVLFLLNIR